MTAYYSTVMRRICDIEFELEQIVGTISENDTTAARLIAAATAATMIVQTVAAIPSIVIIMQYLSFRVMLTIE